MITVKPRREDALKAGFSALLDRLPHAYSFDLFCEKLAEWDVRAFCDGERAVGMLMVKGAELHVAVIPEVRGKWLSRRLIREVFAPILEAHGEAVTSVAPDNPRGLEFVNRLREGFANHTFDPTTALISAGGSLLGGVLQAGASEKAGDQAANAANRATDVQKQMFDTQNQQQQPYRQAGYNALDSLLGGFGLPSTGAGAQSGAPFNVGDIQYKSGGTTGWQANLNGQWTDLNPATTDFAQLKQMAPAGGGQPSGPVDSGYFAHQFNANDLNANLAPNYQFQLDQGLGAVKNAGNLQTGLLSGNTLKGINDYAQNYAGGAYQNAFNNYTANQSNIFNRLSSIAGLGQAANTQSAGLAGSLAPSIASTTQAAGAAQAAGTVGQANALSGGANNALGWYQIGNALNKQTGGSGLDQFSVDNP